MHTLLNLELAKQHRADLEREIEMAALVAQVCPTERTRSRKPALFKRWYNRMALSYQQPVVRHEADLENVSLAEIRPAVLTTFYTLHEDGLVSDYDDRFIETFVETFQGELAHHAECKCG